MIDQTKETRFYLQVKRRERRRALNGRYVVNSSNIPDRNGADVLGNMAARRLLPHPDACSPHLSAAAGDVGQTWKTDEKKGTEGKKKHFAALTDSTLALPPPYLLITLPEKNFYLWLMEFA